MVETNCIVGEDVRYTVSRSESGYTFVNYNFEDMEDLMLG